MRNQDADFEVLMGPIFHCWLAGHQFAVKSEKARLRMWAQLAEGHRVEIRREPRNKHDANACAVHFKKKRIGYVPRELAKILAKQIDAGTEVALFVEDLGYRRHGINGANGLKLVGFILK